MPGCSADSILRIEEIIASMPPLNQLLLEGKTPEDIVDLLSDMKWEPLYTLDLSFQCNCSKDRFRAGLATLPDSDLADLLEDEITSTECQFCRTSYEFSNEEIEELIVSRKKELN